MIDFINIIQDLVGSKIQKTIRIWQIKTNRSSERQPASVVVNNKCLIAT